MQKYKNFLHTRDKKKDHESFDYKEEQLAYIRQCAGRFIHRSLSTSQTKIVPSPYKKHYDHFAPNAPFNMECNQKLTLELGFDMLQTLLRL